MKTFERALLAALADPEVQDLGEARLVAQLMVAGMPKEEPAALSVEQPRDDKGRFASEEEVKPRKFSSTQFNIDQCGYTRTHGMPGPKLQEMAAKIPDAALAEDGREEEFHVTVKYGLHTNSPEEVRKIVEGFGGVAMTLGETSVFEGDEHDVVKVSVDSADLHRLNALIAEKLECTDTYPDYKPHVTLAYVKKGRGKDFAGWDDVKGHPITCHRLVFSSQDKERTTIDLLQSKPLPWEMTQTDASFNVGNLHNDIFNPQAQAILDKAMGKASALSADARKAIEDALSIDDPREMANAVMNAIERYRVQLAELLTKTQVAALLEGAREVAEKLPPLPPAGFQVPLPPTIDPTEAEALLNRLNAMPEMERALDIYQRPAYEQNYLNQMLRMGIRPPAKPPEVQTTGGSESEWPIIDEAVRSLSARNVMDRFAFDQLDAAARQKAFTVTGIDAEESLAKLRGLLAQSAGDGEGYKDFRKKALAEVEEAGFLTEPRLETVFRTNIQTAFSDGTAKVTNMPFVKSAFPYAAYHCIHDDRARANHKRLETLGIDGTNMYRIEDPVFQMFRPPWDYNDRCSWNPLTVRQAAEKGLKEAQQWLETGIEPAPTYVAMPDFRPPAGFQRSPSAVPLSLDAAFAQVHAPVGGVTIGGEYYAGGQFIPGEAFKSLKQEEKDAILNREHVRADDDGNILAHFKDLKDVKYTQDRDFVHRFAKYIDSHLQDEFKAFDRELELVTEARDDEDDDVDARIQDMQDVRDAFVQQVYSLAEVATKGMLQRFSKEGYPEGYIDTTPFEDRVGELRDAIEAKAYEVSQAAEDGDDIDSTELYDAINSFDTELLGAYDDLLVTPAEEKDEQERAEDDAARAELDDRVSEASDEIDDLMADGVGEDEAWQQVLKRHNAELEQEGHRFRLGLDGNNLAAVYAEDLDDEFKPDAKMAIGGAFDESKHKRGNPKNAGQFAKKGGGQKKTSQPQRVKPEPPKSAPAPVQQAQPQPVVRQDQPHAAPSPQGVAAAFDKVLAAEHAVADWIDKQVSKLPPKLEKPVRAVWATLMVTYSTAQKMVEEVAAERGATPEQVKRITAIAATADAIAGGKGAPAMAVRLGAGLMGASAAGFIPVGSLAYLGYSAVRNPMKTLRGAKRAIKKLLAGKQQQQQTPASLSLEFALRGAEMPTKEAVSRLMDHMQGPHADRFEALVMAALDETRGDLDAAIDMARMVMQQEGAKFSSEDGQWITIGGREEGEEKHKGGFPVFINRDGVILKGGPKGLRGKKVGETKTFFDGQRGEKKGKGEQKADAKPQAKERPFAKPEQPKPAERPFAAPERQEEQPAPEDRPFAPPQEVQETDPIKKSLDALPDGATIWGFTKKGNDWTQGDTTVTAQDLIETGVTEAHIESAKEELGSRDKIQPFKVSEEFAGQKHGLIRQAVHDARTGVAGATGDGAVSHGRVDFAAVTRAGEALDYLDGKRKMPDWSTSAGKSQLSDILGHLRRENAYATDEQKAAGMALADELEKAAKPAPDRPFAPPPSASDHAADVKKEFGNLPMSKIAAHMKEKGIEIPKMDKRAMMEAIAKHRGGGGDAAPQQGDGPKDGDRNAESAPTMPEKAAEGGKVEEKKAGDGKIRHPLGEWKRTRPDGVTVEPVQEGDEIQPETINVKHAKGYSGKMGNKSYVAKITGPDSRMGLDREFQDGDIDWGDSQLYKKSKGVYSASHTVSEDGGVYEINEFGDRDYMVYFPARVGGKPEMSSISVSEKALKDAYQEMESAGIPFDELPAAAAYAGGSLVERVKAYAEAKAKQE